ncbi:universal stress protein [Clostridium cylindrosporum]|uniref:UspA domain-containing protein n=1 Tax=Clostridium cylindrosporum DSM 605 TaxID=1121307 RepID=A0A0J8G2C2_CLOCY|nr:universal stress protein [Clostridium cylindrosporum]KMT21886.1 hypothetical protein CLCY_3c01570 [Clostridium cylindrosporum DSM 605]
MKIKNILIPLDDSERTLESINTTKVLFDKDKAAIKLLHIVDNYDVRGIDARNPNTASDLSKDVLDKGESLLNGYNVEKIAVLGSHSSVVTDILKTIDSNEVDLVIMTKTGKGLFDKYIVGSVTSHILKRSPVPVMIIP